MARKVKIQIRTIGQSFGTAGFVRDLHGHLLAETEVFGYGFEAAAEAAAREICVQRGYKVVKVDSK